MSGDKKRFLGLLMVLFMGMAALLAAVKISEKKQHLDWRSGATVTNNIEKPFFYDKPVVAFGNSSYHDSLGVRDPYVVKENGKYYLFFDCIETLYNPSFEPRMGINGWDTWKASIASTSEKALFGSHSLKLITEPVKNAGAYTGDYYYDGIKDEAHWAVPEGIDVVPGKTYFASVYFWARPEEKLGLLVQQYRDDPKFYFQNVIKDATVVTEATGNGQWQRLVAKFVVRDDAKAITISFVNREDGKKTVSFWDGVQLELAEGKSKPDPFPAHFNFNRAFEDVVGWRSCYAVSEDGTHFTKKGLVEVTGPKQDYEDYIKPGWIGSSGTYLNPFNYQGKWYSYTWVAGYQPESGNSFLKDKGAITRRLGYGDRRAFLPNGMETRSGLVVADRVEGPYKRISPKESLISIEPTEEKACEEEDRSPIKESVPWGCEYLAASGAPIPYQGKWVLFLSGATYRIKDTWRGTLDPDLPGYFGIGSGLAISDSPFGPWHTNAQSRLFSPEEIGETPKALEGPIYYYDKASRRHIVFTNLISGGARAIEAYWSKDLTSGWSVKQMVPVINRCNKPDKNCNEGAINLATVIEASPTKLYLYYGYRETKTDRPYDGLADSRSYLFHNIGLVEFNLPLFSPESVEGRKDSRVLSITPFSGNRFRVKTKYTNTQGLDNLVLLQLIVSKSADWHVKPYYLRAMYVRKKTDVFNPGLYLYDPDTKNQRYGWGELVPIGSWTRNRFGKVRVLSVQTSGDSVEISWELLVDRNQMPPGEYQIYLWQADENSNQQNDETQPLEKVFLYQKNWYFTKAGKLQVK